MITYGALQYLASDGTNSADAPPGYLAIPVSSTHGCLGCNLAKLTIPIGACLRDTGDLRCVPSSRADGKSVFLLCPAPTLEVGPHS